MLILASASPRRRDLLTQAGFEFEILSPDVPEELHPGELPVSYVLRLAREKAAAVAASPQMKKIAAGQDDAPLILAADTTVVAPTGEILAKPEGDADAARMLRLLSGATHQVITGIALLAGDSAEVAAEVTHVTMLTLSEAEIAAYIATGEADGKAGAYAIQGRAGRWIRRIHGCYFNVVGLPLALTAAMIEGMHARRRTSGQRPAIAS